MVGTFGLVVYIYPWLGLAFIPVVLFTVSPSGHSISMRGISDRISQIITIVFYSKTSREISRVESVMRSFVFGNIGEQVCSARFLLDCDPLSR
jgi:hypothetical protein